MITKIILTSFLLILLLGLIGNFFERKLKYKFLKEKVK